MTNLTIKKKFPSTLQKDVYYTKGARFTADKRLRNKARIANFCVAALSLYIIAISIGLLAFDGSIDTFLAKKLNALTIVLSVAAFGYSLVISNSSYELKATEMHQCAMNLNKIFDELDNLSQKNPVDPEKIEEITNKYHKALKKCKSNHETIDYFRFKAESAHEIYEGNYLLIELKSFSYSMGYYRDIALYILPIAFLLVSPFIVIYT